MPSSTPNSSSATDSAAPGFSKRLFVYGTLLPDLAPVPLRSIVDSWKRLGAATLRGVLVDLGEYPALLIDPAALTQGSTAALESRVASLWRRVGAVVGNRWTDFAPVHGEIYELGDAADAVLRVLDAYEDCDSRRPQSTENLYARCEVEVLRSLPDRRIQPDAIVAWAYLSPHWPQPFRLVSGGDYRQYRAGR